MVIINSDAIIDEDFKEVELIGWLYQFYISDKKDEVERLLKVKKQKVRTEDIPADTQLFTPKWIVKYMVENTVGKIYLDYEPDSNLRDQMKYLVDTSTTLSAGNVSDNVIASEAKQSLIKDLTQLTLIDPAAGSGHILVTGFELLFKMYREAGYNAEKAVQNILQHNLYGLDIDDRAMQLARFAVLLKAAQYDAAILEDPIMPHIYSFPEDTLGNLFTQTYYSKNQSNWHDLLGMQLAEPISIEWEETNKGKSKTKKATFKKGDALNEAIVDLLQLHCNEPIAVDYAQELELFWGDFEKPHNYSEFFYGINLLRQGKNLGSAIKLNISTEVYTHIKEQYHNWLLKESAAQLNIEETSIFNLLKPFLEVFFVLAKQYKAVVANPPYMGQKKMNNSLKDYLTEHYPVTKSDLMTVFMEVIPNLTANDSRFALINLPSWLFLSSFEKIRIQYIDDFTFDSLLHMGRGIFGIDFGSVAFAIKKTKSENAIGSYFKLHERNFQHIYYEDIEKLFLYSNTRESYKYDFDQYRGDDGITEIPKQGTEKGLKLFYPNILQSNFSKIPGSPIAYWVSDKSIGHFKKENEIKSSFNSGGRIKTHGNAKYLRFFWEVYQSKIGNHDKKWLFVEDGGDKRKWFGNRNTIVNWSKEAFSFYDSHGGISNSKYWKKEGITWSIVSSRGTSFRYKNTEAEYTSASPTFLPKESASIYYALAFLNTKYVGDLLKIMNPTVNTTSGDVSSLPLILEEKSKKEIENLSKDCVFLSKKDWDSRETSWDFKQSPLINQSNTLKQACQVWQDRATQDFFQLHANEEELNRIFIDIYGLQEELTPEVKLKDITILQEELNGKDLEALEPIFREKGKDAISLPINKAEVLSQFISYAIGVFLGRYRLDKPGLNIAHPNPTEQELASYNVIAKNEAISRKVTIDDDGIVPLMGEDCAFPDDALVRTKDLLLTIWGENALTENINFLREALGMDLHKWLTEKFWGYHTSMYKKKPIYWLFSSNVKKPQNAAFKVLVYMHRMDKYTVQQIQRNYLYPHQEYITNEKNKLEQDEDNLNREQQKYLELLRDWEIECRDYNEVLKTLANQQIEIDLDDGVTVNYAKFEGALAII